MPDEGPGEANTLPKGNVMVDNSKLGPISLYTNSTADTCMSRLQPSNAPALNGTEYWRGKTLGIVRLAGVALIK